MNNPRNNPDDPTDSDEEEFTIRETVLPGIVIVLFVTVIFALGFAAGTTFPANPCPPAIRGTAI